MEKEGGDDTVPLMMGMDSSSSSINKYNSARDKELEENTTNHFFAVFSQFDASFLIVISLCNFV